jgi:hypothetical protein
MTGPEDLTADLPAPRDDEPASLRQDIVDELRDHLECALVRELHTPTSRGCISAEQTTQDAAHERVLARFGNPASIARRLWWDAMKETIMNQRITVAALVVLAAMSVGLFILTWQSVAAGRALAEQTQSATQAMLAESQSVNQRLLAQLQRVSDQSANSDANKPAEWNHLQIRCVYDAENGPPASGVRVLLSSASANTAGIPPVDETTGADGTIDFGQLLYGQYTLMLTAPNGLGSTQSISVRPGQDKLETIICPSGDGLVRFSVRPSLPEDLRFSDDVRQRVYLLWTLRSANAPLGREWSLRIPETPFAFLLSSLDGSRVAAVEGEPMMGPGGITHGRTADPALVKRFFRPDGDGIPPESLPFAATRPDSPVGELLTGYWLLPDTVEFEEQGELLPGYYLIMDAGVCLLDETDKSAPKLLYLYVSDNDASVERRVLTSESDSGRGGPASKPKDYGHFQIQWGIENGIDIATPEYTLRQFSTVATAPPESRLLWVKTIISNWDLQTTLQPGVRVAVNAWSGDMGNSAHELILNGVVLASHRRTSSGPIAQQVQLIVTAEEAEFLASLPLQLEVKPMSPETTQERTYLTPEVRDRIRALDPEHEADSKPANPGKNSADD